MTSTGRQHPRRPIRSVKRSEGVVVVEAAGDVDLDASTAFQQALLELLDEDTKTIVIDLAGVAYMDSSGVASLVKLLSRTRRKGVSLKLVAPSQKVRNIFEITRLDTVFEIHDAMPEVPG